MTTEKVGGGSRAYQAMISLSSGAQVFASAGGVAETVLVSFGRDGEKLLSFTADISDMDLMVGVLGDALAEARRVRGARS